MKKYKPSGLVACIVYAAVLGAAAFVLGRIVPKHIFNAEKFPFRCTEREKKLYSVLRVKKWQNKLPDMSRVFKRIMPAKRITAQTLGDIPRMIEETCVAEATHALLGVLGLGMLWLWPGLGGVIAAAVYILLGNLPYIIIQRYNRPRLMRLAACKAGKAQSGKGTA